MSASAPDAKAYESQSGSILDVLEELDRPDVGINFDPANVRTSQVSELTQVGIMWTGFRQVVVMGLAVAGVIVALTGCVSYRVGKRLGADSVELNTQREEYSAIATSGESSRVIIASAERWKPFGGEGADEDGDAEAGTYNTVDERV